MVKKALAPTRDEKLESLMFNHSMIFLGMFEEAFADIAEKMTEVLGAGAVAAADALAGGPLGGDLDKKLKEVSPQLRSEIGHVFSGIREEMAEQWPKNPKVFKEYVSGPAFDEGIQIVERYDFGRPKLTEKVSDQVLASYVFLLKGGDAELGKMYKELADWEATLPKPPWRE